MRVGAGVESSSDSFEVSSARKGYRYGQRGIKKRNGIVLHKKISRIIDLRSAVRPLIACFFHGRDQLTREMVGSGCSYVCQVWRSKMEG